MDDRDDDLPAQPRAGQAARRAARAARHPARRPERGDHRACASGWPSRRREPILIPGGDDRGRHAAHGQRGGGRLPGRRGLHDPGGPPGRLRAAARRPGQGRRPRRRRGAAAGRRPARVRHRRRRSATRSTSASRSRSPAADAGRRRRLAGARRRRGPRGPAAALGGLPGRRRMARGRVLEDLTGGFNYGSGTVELELPGRAARSRSPASGLHWLRCRHRRHDPRRAATRHDLHAAAGDLLDHRRADRRAAAAPRTPRRSRARSLGVSDGTPGQIFPLRYTRRCSSSAARARRSRSRTRESGDWRALGAARVFVEADRSTATSRSTSSSGEVELGPAIRETDGGWTPVRRVPPKGAVLRFTSYRHGGGRHGNVAAGTLTVLKSTIAGVDTVTNPTPAVGGVDAETLEQRAPARGDGDPLALPRGHRRGLRVPGRRGVAARGARGLHPAARRRRRAAAHRPARLPGRPPARATTSCVPDEDAAAPRSPTYLDERRLIGTTVRAAARAASAALSVVVNLQASPLRRHRARRGGRRARALHVPEPAGRRQPDGPGAGWAFGRALNQGELYGVVHAVDGVEFVKILRIYETNLETGEQSAKPAGTTSCSSPTS